MNLEIIEITLSEFTKITGQLAELRDKLHQLEPLAQAQRTLLELSPDPAREIMKLRDHVEDKSARITQLQAEIRGKTPLNTEKRATGVSKEQIVEMVLDIKPDLTVEEKTLLQRLAPALEKAGFAGSAVSTSAETQLTSLKDSLQVTKSENSRLKMKIEALEGNIEALQSSLDFIMTESDSLRKKIKQFEDTQLDLGENMRKKDDEIEYYKKFAKEKYDLELKNQELELQCEKLERNCEMLKTGMEELTIKACDGIENDELRTQIEQLKHDLESKQRKIDSLHAELMQEKLKKPQESSQSAANLHEISTLKSQIHQSHLEIQSLSQQLEDSKFELPVLEKKHSQELKSLKSEIAKERGIRMELERSLAECKGELHRVQEVKMMHARVVAASTHEKKMVETLRNRVDELEARNRFLLVTMQQVDDVKQELIREKQRSTQLSEELRKLKTCV